MTVAHVVPDVPTYAVDDGFRYRIPAELPPVSVGSLVRVPLAGRRVRGWVVSIEDNVEPDRPLKDIVAVSGDLPVFHPRLLDTLRWLALHYVAPLAALLRKAGPPNLPKHRATPSLPAVPELDASSLPDLVGAAVARRQARPRYLVGGGPWRDEVATAAAPVLAAGRSVLVVVPTASEAESMFTALGDAFGARVVMGTSALSAARVTTAWVRAATTPGLAIVGTREVATWPVADLGLALVVEEGRRAMKSPQTPTIHVREVLRRRAAIERFGLGFMSSVPTVEAIAGNVEVIERPGRTWGVVEVVGRSDEPPGSVVLEHTRQALRTVVGRGGRAFVFVPRRGYAPAWRCASCGEFRRCTQCGSGGGRGADCERCGASLGACDACGARRFVPVGVAMGRVAEDLARSIQAPDRLVVGTERDLVGVQPVDLAVAVDVDRMLLAPHYRAGEDTLRVLARVAGLVGGRGGGRRCIVETDLPDHPVIQTLRSGQPLEFLRKTAADRAEAGFPPAGDLIAFEVTDPPATAGGDLVAAVGDRGHVLGPASVRERTRWLVQGRDLAGVKAVLRGVVHEWREAGATVRIDADPTDL